jgi:hypothetical protein
MKEKRKKPHVWQEVPEGAHILLFTRSNGLFFPFSSKGNF